MLKFSKINVRAVGFCAVIGLALIMAGCEEFVSMSPDEASEAMLSGADCECNAEGTLACTLKTSEESSGPRRIGLLEDAEFCNADLLKSKGMCTCTDGKLLCTFFPGSDGSAYGRTEFGQKFVNVSANIQPVTLEVGTCEAGETNGSQGCFAPCDPSKPTCSEGLSCQARADGTFICFDAVACSSGGGADQPTVPAADQPSGQTTCKCDGTTLVCSDGNVGEFNPACMGGGGGSTCGNTVCDPGEDSTNCQVDCGKP